MVIEKFISCKIYVARHGETYDNKNKIFSGFRNSKLTSKGLADAKILAKKLKDKNINIGFVSHLFRMKKTLSEVLKYHKGAKVIIDDRILERCYGRLQGTSKKKMEKSNPKLYEKYHRSYDIPPPGGESIKMVEKRVFEFCKYLKKMVRDKRVNVAVICGNNSMRALRRYFENLSIKQELTQENSCIDYVEYEIKV